MNTGSRIRGVWVAADATWVVDDILTQNVVHDSGVLVLGPPVFCQSQSERVAEPSSVVALTPPSRRTSPLPCRLLRSSADTYARWRLKVSCLSPSKEVLTNVPSGASASHAVRNAVRVLVSNDVVLEGAIALRIREVP